jgi:hypothetical protein
VAIPAPTLSQFLPPSIRPLLILPEVLDGSKWKRGSLWFMDPEQQYVLRLVSSELEQLSINTKQVKPADLRTARDLLDPKWRGRIATQDPTVPGTGSNHAAELYVQLGEAFAKALYVDQKPAISRDERQLTASSTPFPDPARDRATLPDFLGRAQRAAWRDDLSAT